MADLSARNRKVVVPAVAEHAARAEHAAVPYADVAETHSASVFFVGDRAFKLKKPVDLGFLDFRTRRSREAACRREMELNRRFAPDVYLGVAEVRDPAGQTCEHLLVMRRMPPDRRLSTLVRASAPVADQVRQVARALAAQHAKAPRGPEISHQGSRNALQRRWSANIEQSRRFARPLALQARIDETERLAMRFLGGRELLFEERIRGGRVVDGHGDLLADDVFCLDDGPRILDCLDFDDRLRWLDGLDDAACFAMDLQRLGASEAAGRFMDTYAEYSADPAPRALRHHYMAYRAFMRAKVSCLQWDQGDQAAGGAAAGLADLALEHLRAGAVALVLVGGLPGTGKSTLAGELADQLGCTVLSTDRIRKELAGIPAERPSPAAYGAGIYTAEWTQRTYGELLRRTARLLSLGETVIADGSWNASQHRAAAAAVAGRAQANLIPLRCSAPAGVTADRLRSRGPSVSDADEEVARRFAAARDPWPDAVVVDTSGATSGHRAAGAPATAGRSGSPLSQALTAIRAYQAGGHDAGNGPS